MKHAWLGLVAVTALAGMADAQRVTGVGNFVHVVADLDKAVAFYRDGLGLEVVTPAGSFVADDAMMRLGDTPGAQVRRAELRVQGSRLGVELVEYRGIDRRAAQPRLEDPGAGVLRIGVQDLLPTIRRAQSTGWRPVMGDVIAPLPGAILQDGDGFVAELTQVRREQTGTSLTYPTAPPQPVMPARGEDLEDGFLFSVGDLDETISAYYEATGVPATGTHKGELRLGATTITFFEFKTGGRKPLHTRVQDPGTSILQLHVRGLDAMLANMKAAGFKVVTAGGAPVRAGDARMVLVRDLNNLYLELIERDVV